MTWNVECAMSKRARSTQLRHRRIPIVSAIRTGSTLLSSFDDALNRCGVCNYNLIPLSSVIPPRSQVAPVDRHVTPGTDFGQRLYVVKADIRSDLDGDVLAAGIGSYQWGDHRGVFVEHGLIDRSLAQARGQLSSLIHASLRDLCLARDVPFDPNRVGSCVTAAPTAGVPTTAVVLAVYQAEGWRDESTPIRGRARPRRRCERVTDDPGE
jgi:arginine decarboxylase